MGQVEGAFAQSFGAGVTEFEFDVFAIGFDRFAAKAEFLGNSARAETCTNEAEHVKLTITQARDAVIMCIRPLPTFDAARKAALGLRISLTGSYGPNGR